MRTTRNAWSIEDFYKEIPVVNLEEKQKSNLLNYGVSNYVYHVYGVEEEEYLDYQKTLKEAGFEKYMENTEGIKGHFYSATFLKEDIVVTVTYWKTAKRLSISGALTLYRNVKSAEEAFADVPTFGLEAEHRGDGVYMVSVEDISEADYKAYLENLKTIGFEKYADNGEGFGGTVLQATYTRENQVVSVLYTSLENKMFISAAKDMPLSEHLQYKEEYVADNKANAKTSIHMVEQWHFGNSFVIQLKNGHFIINDGGNECEAEYLLEYLESLVPEGEKPVVEAWLITHMHRDHCGVVNALAELPHLADRIYIEGFYYSEPNDNILGIQPGVFSNIIYLKMAAETYWTTKGTNPKVYRPQTGQRYYFCDITMDIVLSQEHLPQNMCAPDLNDSSTVCMYTIEGQKSLFMGDIERGGMRRMMAIYTSEYMTLDMFTLPHHGFNTRNDFTDFCGEVTTVLVTARDKLPARRVEQNDYLKERAEEWVFWGDGTKVFSFPYTVGSYVCLPQFDWKYHVGKERPVQPNLD